MSEEMTYGHLGRSGLLVSRIGLGTMNFGYTVDEAATDPARFFYAPRASVDGTQRDATVRLIRQDLMVTSYSVACSSSGTISWDSSPNAPASTARFVSFVLGLHIITWLVILT